MNSKSIIIVLYFRKPTPSPPAVASSISGCQNVYQSGSTSTGCSGTNPNSSSTTCIQGSQSCNKEAWPSLQPGLTTNSNNNGLYKVNEVQFLKQFNCYCIYLNGRQSFFPIFRLKKKEDQLEFERAVCACV